MFYEEKKYELLRQVAKSKEQYLLQIEVLNRLANDLLEYLRIFEEYELEIRDVSSDPTSSRVFILSDGRGDVVDVGLSLDGLAPRYYLNGSPMGSIQDELLAKLAGIIGVYFARREMEPAQQDEVIQER